MTTAGTVAGTFLLPAASTKPLGITPGPDGTLWFTEWNKDKIGQITTGGMITEYKVPTAASKPWGIAPGPDGQPVVGAVDTAQVTWASADPPAGFVFNVQVEQPGSDAFIPWQTGVTSLSATLGPGSPLWAGTGTYQFRAQLENAANGATSGFSAPGSISLGGSGSMMVQGDEEHG